jgi:hypothetical protein
MATGTGVNASKVLVYSVLSAMPGVSASKIDLYSVLAPPNDVDVSKVNVYSVLGTAIVQPPIWPGIVLAPGIFGNAYQQDFDLAPAASPTTFTVFLPLRYLQEKCRLR